MKKIIIFILIAALMLFSCKNNSTDANNSEGLENTDGNNGSNNGNTSSESIDGSITIPPQIEKYAIDIATATTQKIEEALKNMRLTIAENIN